MTANGKCSLREFLVYRNNSTELDGFALIFVHVFHQIPIPDCIVPVINPNNGCFDVKRQRVFDLVIFYFPIGIFIGNVRSPANCPDNLVKFHLVHILGKAVEYHQFTGVQLIYNQTPHIGVVVHKGCGIDKAHLLINCPVVRNVFKQELQLPHSVVFQNDPFCLMFFQQFGHSFVGLCAGIDDHFNFIRNDIGGYAAAFDAGNFTGPGNDRIDFNSRNRIDSDSGCLDCVDTQVRTCAVTG